MEGENVRKFRELKNMSQTELAEKVHVSAPMICMIERGSKVLSMPLAKQIAAVLEIDIADL